VDINKEFSNFGRRLEKFAQRFEEKNGRDRGKKAAEEPRSPMRALLHDLRSLFTEGVTRDGIRDLIKKDLREASRFYARGIDYAPYESLPWFKRYPAKGLKTFIALAKRLSPPRRVAFAIAIILFLFALIRLIVFFASLGPPGEDSGIGFFIVSFAVLFILLFMELRDKLDLKGDLEIAREIQAGLVPAGEFRQNGISINSYMRPANTVGGDYYDIIDLSEERVGIVIGDVSGKGMPAALLMALMQGSLRTLISAGLRGPELISKLNVYLCANTPLDRLITLFYGEMNTSTGELRYVNAGHNSPVLVRSNRQLDRLQATAMVLGVDRNVAFEAKTVGLNPGDRLLLYTDGISEAFNANEEEYGEARLTAFLQAQSQISSRDLIDRLVSDVLAFCEPAKPHDDMTLMFIARA
jgi:sigma-B regulation protein RsbU (phosphoserine phosphatase)